MTCKQVSQLRKNLGETREQFAKRLGVSKKAVESWEYIKPPSKGAALILLTQLQESCLTASGI